MKGEVCLGLGKVLADGNWVADVDYTIYKHEQVHAWLLPLRGDFANLSSTCTLILEAPAGAHYQICVQIGPGRGLDQSGRYVVDVTPLPQQKPV